MKIYINFGTILSNKTNHSSLTIELSSESTTLPDLFHFLKINYAEVYNEISSEDNTLNSSIICIHNNNVVYANQFQEIVVNDKDKISFTLAIGGG